MTTWSEALKRELIEDSLNWYGEANWDADRFGPLNESFWEKLITVLFRIGLGHFKIFGIGFRRIADGISNQKGFIRSLEALYDLLEDDYSKDMLVKVIAYRLFGFRKVMLPFNTPSYREKLRDAETLVTGKGRLQTQMNNWVLDHCDLRKIGYPIELFYRPAAIPVAFMIKQYEYGKSTPVIGACNGDILIDAGACWGDSSLFFAHSVGPNGRVFAFEFEPENQEIIKKNLALNPNMSGRISIIPYAVWDVSGEKIGYASHGPATSLLKEQNLSQTAATMAIDDFISQEGIDRVDFVKMDIEGAELKALQGAEKTLRRFKPRLAISLYHQEQDFIAIPKYLDGLRLGYEFYLDHFTMHKEETVLFARPRA